MSYSNLKILRSRFFLTHPVDTIPRNQPESFAFHARSIFKSVDSHAFVLMVVHILRLCQLCQDIYIVHSTKSASGWRHSSICLRSPVSHKYPYSYTSNQQQQLTTAATTQQQCVSSLGSISYWYSAGTPSICTCTTTNKQLTIISTILEMGHWGNNMICLVVFIVVP